ncbi:hypothetical protein ARMSODRAFT_37495 [Armillaria solidipes]|uniref:Uncharacterized protein n=1 Tax=Armillaria solidipes TaxID=1076256 RepID=A0A2H3CGN2_9AGAR|nr:hypothetical protein ARMSODRAFT_37495 [Armillaria solidipes]
MPTRSAIARWWASLHFVCTPSPYLRVRSEKEAFTHFFPSPTPSMNDSFPPPTSSHLRRFHPYPRYDPPLVVDLPLRHRDPNPTIVAATTMVRQDVAREKRPEGGEGWEWVAAVFIAFAILERVLERANLL